MDSTDRWKFKRTKGRPLNGFWIQKMCNCPFKIHSDNVDYQTVFSFGNGEVVVLGVVPHSHITIMAYSVEDGEIIKQVIEDFPSNMKYINGMWHTV